jgi:hypothetical protein
LFSTQETIFVNLIFAPLGSTFKTSPGHGIVRGQGRATA